MVYCTPPHTHRENTMRRYIYQLDFYANDTLLTSRIVELHADDTHDPEVRAYEISDSLISQSSSLATLVDQVEAIQLV